MKKSTVVSSAADLSVTKEREESILKINEENIVAGAAAVSSETAGIRDNFGIFDIPYKMILGII